MPLQPARAAFTLIELLVVVAILALLAAMLFPVFSTAREKARQASCASNLRQMGLGLVQYAQDFDDFFPNNDNSNAGGRVQNAFEMLEPYLKSNEIFICPSAPEEARRYFYNDVTRSRYTYSLNNIYSQDPINRIFEKPASSMGSLSDPSNTIFTGDAQYFAAGSTATAWQVLGSSLAYRPTDPPSFGSNDRGRFAFRHQGGANFVFFDGHVKWLSTFVAQKRAEADPTKYFYFTRTTK